MQAPCFGALIALVPGPYNLKPGHPAVMDGQAHDPERQEPCQRGGFAGVSGAWPVVPGGSGPGGGLALGELHLGPEVDLGEHPVEAGIA